jgi:CheY-like chemotaxis protein
MLRILHLDDSDPDRELICRAMVAQGIKAEVHGAKSGEDFARILADVPVDLVLCDSGGPRFHGREALALVRQLQPDAVFVFVTGQCKGAIAESLAASGADGIVRKDYLAEMAEVLPRAFERQGRALYPPIPPAETKSAG